MKGLWLPAEEHALKRLKEPHATKILSALKARGKEGLSNAEIDSMLGTASQWLIYWEMRELISLDFVKYEVHPFGEAGKYTITEKGLAAMQEARIV